MIPTNELIRQVEHYPDSRGALQTLQENPALANKLAEEWSGSKILRQSYHGHFERFADTKLKSVPDKKPAIARKMPIPPARKEPTVAERREGILAVQAIGDWKKFPKLAVGFSDVSAYGDYLKRDFNSLINGYKRAGLSEGQAIRKVAHEHPDAHAKYLTVFNAKLHPKGNA